MVDPDQVDAWADQPGVAAAAPMGAGMVNASTDDGTQVDLTLFGVQPGSFLAPEAGEGEGLGDIDGVVVAATARSEGIELGTVLRLDRLDTELRVVGFTQSQATFGHVDIAYVPLPTWQLVASGQAAAGAPTREQVEALDFSAASVVALQAEEGVELDLAAGDAAAGTTSMALEDSFTPRRATRPRPPR